MLTVTIEFIKANPSGDQPYAFPLVDLIASYWEEIGVRAEILPMDWGAFKAVRNIAVDPAMEMIGRVKIATHTIKPNAPACIKTPFSGVMQSYNILWNGEEGAYPELQDKILELYRVIDEELIRDTIMMADETDTMFPICTITEFKAIGHDVEVTFDFPDYTASMVAAEAVPKK
jgi:ABC-type transport system substrate-binding protein